MATLKNRLGSLIAKPKMKLEDKKNAGSNTQQTPPAQKSLPNQTTDFAGGSRQSPILSGAVGNRSTSPSNIAGNSGLATQRASSPANGALGGKKPPIFGAVTGGVGAILPKTDSDDKGSKGQVAGRAKDPYIPISVVTGSRGITTVSPELRAFLLKGSPSATTAMPQEYADLANLLNKAGSTIDFQNWADKTAMQQLSITQKAGLSLKDQQLLLNSSPHYVETIAKVQDIFANRYTLGITVADARNVASELFDIASERDAASRRTGKYANDAVFAPKALRWLDEEEKNILDGLGKNTGETGQGTWYNGEDSQQSGSDDRPSATQNGSSNGYIQVPGKEMIGSGRNNPPVNCYGYVLMNLGIQPSDGNYDVQPGMLSETRVGDHAHAEGSDRALNTDTETIIEYIIRDIEKTGRDIRVIESREDAAEGEILVALKNDNFFFGGDQYHVAIQLPDGTWADKRGTGYESRQGEIDNPDGPWAAEWWKYVYDTETYYFAISES